MKDKLTKTGHKKAYYRFRAFGIAFASLLGLGFSASLPIFVTYEVSVNATLAKDAKEEDSHEQESEEVYTIEVEE